VAPPEPADEAATPASKECKALELQLGLLKSKSALDARHMHLHKRLFSLRFI
jgi:hypothetical protein